MNNYEIDYKRESISPGILHFGVGNFHRAHQEYYTNLLLKDADQNNWGYCGAMILEKDEELFRSLKRQNCRFGLTVRGRTGQDEYRQIGSLIELLWGVENPEAVIDKVADPAIKIITLTITEGGYNIYGREREFDFYNEDIIHDLTKPSKPRTVFGYITAGLRKRMDTVAGPVTILSCDNLPHNGDACKKAFHAFIEKADRQLFDWVLQNVTFPNCMVDRITPATLPDDIKRLAAQNGHEDLAPVYCEDFALWVIEDDFIAGRPAWERAGVLFTKDVTVYEFMKLGYVNSTHQALSCPAFLAGYRKVDEALGDKRIETYLHQWMELDVTPYLKEPPDMDLLSFRTTFMERLKNKSTSDQLARLCFDEANKFPVFSAPTFGALLKAKADMRRIAFFVATYRVYLRGERDERGVSYTINDPGLTEADWKMIYSEDPLAFLRLTCFSSIDIAAEESFVRCYLEYIKSIGEKGALKTLETII